MRATTDVTLAGGNRMPLLGLGTWRLNKNTAESVEHALRIGYRMIDTSHDYGTQPGVAEGIKRSGKSRGDYYLVTKVEETEEAYEATVRNLAELKHDYADLILIHRPPKHGAGEELWQGLIRAKYEGMARDIGVSNYRQDQIEALMEDSGITPVVNQIEWSPFGHSQAMLEFCDRHHIIIQAYSPLTHSKRLGDNRLKKMAKKYGKSVPQILIRWNLQVGTVPIIKANSAEHQQENLDVFDFELSFEDMAILNSLNQKYSALGSLAYR